jgi:hypothetical protein
VVPPWFVDPVVALHTWIGEYRRGMDEFRAKIAAGRAEYLRNLRESGANLMVVDRGNGRFGVRAPGAPVDPYDVWADDPETLAQI